ncbi:MAG: nicotinate (nicotinamide) nucleotide adenylyltransferase [Gammaproteobacteria bacterium]|nr:nicotinate (nicotinamide) nucleotide adenylyltransferase [Gammaproteobacteria bacterium]
MAKNKLIGIFGGTFDPIHIGHLRVIENIISLVQLDELIVIPNGIPPHKEKRISAELKLEMARNTLGHIQNLKIDDRELIKNTPSFAYETLLELKRDYPEDNFLWIMGTDSFDGIATWYSYEKFVNESNLLILQRPNLNIQTSNPFESEIKKMKRIAKTDFEDGTTSIFLLDIEPIEITSTEIRKMVANNENIAELVHPKVNKLIQRNNLYQT